MLIPLALCLSRFNFYTTISVPTDASLALSEICGLLLAIRSFSRAPRGTAACAPTHHNPLPSDKRVAGHKGNKPRDATTGLNIVHDLSVAGAAAPPTKRDAREAVQHYPPSAAATMTSTTSAGTRRRARASGNKSQRHDSRFFHTPWSPQHLQNGAPRQRGDRGR